MHECCEMLAHWLCDLYAFICARIWSDAPCLLLCFLSVAIDLVLAQRSSSAPHMDDLADATVILRTVLVYEATHEHCIRLPAVRTLFTGLEVLLSRAVRHNKKPLVSTCSAATEYFTMV